MIATIFLYTTGFDPKLTFLYILLPIVAGAAAPHYVLVCSLRRHVGYSDWQCKHNYRQTWKDHRQDLAKVFQTLKIGSFGFFVAVGYLVWDASYLRPLASISTPANSVSFLGTVPYIKVFRPVVAAIIRKICFSCYQAALNPWILRARTPALIVYAAVVKTHLILGFLNVYTLAGCRDWMSVAIFAAVRWVVFADMCRGQKCDPETHRSGIACVNSFVAFSDSMRVRAYRVDEHAGGASGASMEGMSDEANEANKALVDRSKNYSNSTEGDDPSGRAASSSAVSPRVSAGDGGAHRGGRGGPKAGQKVVSRGTWSETVENSAGAGASSKKLQTSVGGATIGAAASSADPANTSELSDEDQTPARRPVIMRLYDIRAFEFLWCLRVQSILFFSLLFVIFPYAHLCLSANQRKSFMLYQLLFPEDTKSAIFYTPLLVMDLLQDLLGRRVVRVFSGRKFSMHFRGLPWTDLGPRLLCIASLSAYLQVVIISQMSFVVRDFTTGDGRMPWSDVIEYFGFPG